MVICNRVAAYLVLLTVSVASLLLRQEQTLALSDGIREYVRNITNSSSREDQVALDQVALDHVYCDRNSSHPICCSEEQCTILQKSTLYSKCCGNLLNPNNTKAKLYPLLITATPRSGTQFMTMLINKLEGSVVHDWSNASKGKNGMVSWIHIMKEPKENWFGPAKLDGGKFYSAWHQLRDPLKGLTSLTFSEPLQAGFYLEYLNRHIQVDGWCYNEGRNDYSKYQCLIQQGLQFYTQWHQYINQLKLPTFKLEDLVVDYNMTLLDEIFDSMNLPPPNHTKALSVIQSDQRRRRRRLAHTNSRKHRPTLEWWELCQVNQTMTNEFLQLSQQFGYYEDMIEPCNDAAMAHAPTNYTHVNAMGIEGFFKPERPKLQTT